MLGPEKATVVAAETVMEMAAMEESKMHIENLTTAAHLVGGLSIVIYSTPGTLHVCVNSRGGCLVRLSIPLNETETRRCALVESEEH